MTTTVEAPAGAGGSTQPDGGGSVENVRDESDGASAVADDSGADLDASPPAELEPTLDRWPRPGTMAIEIRLVPHPRPLPRVPLLQVVPGRPDPPPRPPRQRTPPDPRDRVLPTLERLGREMVPTYRHRDPLAPSRTEDVTPGRSGASAEPDLRQACCMVATAAVEVIAGRRPVAQLARWVTPAIYQALEQRRRLSAPSDGPRSVLPRVTGSSTARATVRKVRTVRITADVVESAVVLGQADRVRAVAVRLVRRQGCWRAEALVVG